MLKFSGNSEFPRENSYFERIRMIRTVRMVRMVRSLADRTFQLRREHPGASANEPWALAGAEARGPHHSVDPFSRLGVVWDRFSEMWCKFRVTNPSYPIIP